MAHSTVVCTPAPLRRALSAVFRGGPLSERDADVVSRLARDVRTAMRLLVGAGVVTFDEALAREASAALTARGVPIDEVALLRCWRAALRCGDQWAPCDTVSRKIGGFNGGDDAAALADVAGLDRWTRGLIVLLGGSVESILAPVRRQEAA